MSFLALSGKRLLARAHSIDDLRVAAKKTLPRMVFDFVDGGAQTESTVRANRAALERYRLVASGPVDVHERSTAIDLFGARLLPACGHLRVSFACTRVRALRGTDWLTNSRDRGDETRKRRIGRSHAGGHRAR